MKILIILFGLSISFCASAQYDLDRHNTASNSGWVSCDIKISPNSERPAGHWIMYDFNEIYQLGNTHFWNSNSGMEKSKGIKEFVIDYSMDGVKWDTWGKAELKQAEISGYYTGEEGPDLSGLSARYLLITALSSHGGDCVGFSEVRFQTEGIVSDLDEIGDLSASLKASPSPFLHNTIIEIADVESGMYQYQITDMAGRVIMSSNINISGDEMEIQLDGSEWPQGLYVFTLGDGKRLKSLRIEKIRNN